MKTFKELMEENGVEASNSEAEGVGRGVFQGFMAYIHNEAIKQYHAGFRDGMKLNLAARQISERAKVLDMSVEELEFSVRTGNCIRGNGVTTIAELLSLERHTVLSWKNAGSRTWREIADMQSYLKGA